MYKTKLTLAAIAALSSVSVYAADSDFSAGVRGLFLFPMGDASKKQFAAGDNLPFKFLPTAGYTIEANQPSASYPAILIGGYVGYSVSDSLGVRVGTYWGVKDIDYTVKYNKGGVAAVTAPVAAATGSKKQEEILTEKILKESAEYRGEIAARNKRVKAIVDHFDIDAAIENFSDKSADQRKTEATTYLVDRAIGPDFAGENGANEYRTLLGNRKTGVDNAKTALSNANTEVANASTAIAGAAPAAVTNDMRNNLADAFGRQANARQALANAQARYEDAQRGAGKALTEKQKGLLKEELSKRLNLSKLEGANKEEISKEIKKAAKEALNAVASKLSPEEKEDLENSKTAMKEALGAAATEVESHGPSHEGAAEEIVNTVSLTLHVPVMVGVEYKIMESDVFSLGVNANVGWAMWKASWSVDKAPASPAGSNAWQTKGESDRSHSIALMGGLEAGINLGDVVRLSGSVGYGFFGEPDVKWGTYNDQNKADLTANQGFKLGAPVRGIVASAGLAIDF